MVEVVGYPTQGRPIVTLGQIGSVLEETLSPGQGLSRAVCAKFAKEPSSSVAELADLASASAEKPAAAALSPVVAPSKQERVLVAAGKRAAKAAAAAAAAEKPLADVAKAVGVASVEGEESAGAMVVVKATTAAAADGAVVDAASPDVSESVQEEMRIAARDAFLVAVREREAHLEAQYLAMAPEAVMVSSGLVYTSICMTAAVDRRKTLTIPGRPSKLLAHGDENQPHIYLLVCDVSGWEV